MSDALAPRGPDGSGLWIDPRPGRASALVHRRLAIIDQPCGKQPMANEDGAVQVVFNGEIYNHAELRRELMARGHRFATDHSDTEVLVHGWEEWGTELPTRLRGMFAFAIVDTRAGESGRAAGDTLFLARDRMGQKPLFYATLEDGLVFGSTIPSVLAWPEVPRRVPRQQLALYLRMGFLPPPTTIFRDISQLSPGGWLRIRGELVDGGQYWPPPASPAQLHPPLHREEAISRLRDTIGHAVESQLIADVPIACFLSGGIDSSIVASLMQESVLARGGEPIQTVSVGFAEARFDETQYAAAVAEKIGSRHTRLEVRAGDKVLETLRSLMRFSLGQPFADASILPTYQLSRAVRQVAPVALSGDGADELFGGYDRYRAIALLSRWRTLARALPGAVPLGELSRRERWRRLSAAARESDPWDRYTRLLEIFTPGDIEELLPPTSTHAADDGAPDPFDLPGGLSAFRLALFRDQREYLPGDVLWKVDSASMLEALEVRSPFLDHEVVALANRLPDDLLVRGGVGKWILREAFSAELPAVVRSRGKKGFAAPIADWFNGDLRPALRDLLLARSSFVGAHLHKPAIERLLAEHHAGSRDHALRLFALLMLELFAAEFSPTIES